MPKTTPKKPRNEKTFILRKVQRRLIDVYGYKNFLNPPSVRIVREVNQFVTEHADHNFFFEKKHSDMPCPGIVHLESENNAQKRRIWGLGAPSDV